MESQMKAYEGLRNTAAIIFGVMGAWLAILHPNSLKIVFGEKTGEVTDKDKQTIKILLQPILAATGILIVVLILSPTALLAKTFPFLLEHRSFLRGASFSLLCSLTVLQLWALLMTLVPGDILQRSIQAKEKDKQVRKRLFGQVGKQPKDRK